MTDEHDRKKRQKSNAKIKDRIIGYCIKNSKQMQTGKIEMIQERVYRNRKDE